MNRITALISSLIGFVIVAFAQDVMTNESVLSMVKAGLSDAVIVESIDQHPGTYALSAEALISFKGAGVSDVVIAAMQGKMKSAPANHVTAVNPTVAPPVRHAGNREISFHKSKLADVKGKQANIDLIFSDPKESIIVNVAAGHTIASIPYAATDKLSYEYSKHHRIKQGAIVMVASLGAGAIVMLTSSKSHWLTIEYHEENAPKTLVLRMDKSEYQKILKTAKTATGKDIASENY